MVVVGLARSLLVLVLRRIIRLLIMLSWLHRRRWSLLKMLWRMSISRKTLIVKIVSLLLFH